MSLFPVKNAIYPHGRWSSWDYPLRIPDPHFGLGHDDSHPSSPSLYGGFLLLHRTRINEDSPGRSEVNNDPD
ncbi:hypothetical protein TNCV_2634961 [Trichonephila clavipes]|nr:hypothetical protein TNCV_2634961 [Trichonephila clavipes]